MVFAEVTAPDIEGRRADGRAYLKARFNRLLDWTVAFWVFSGSVVITEPSPYELSFFLVLGAALFAGSFAFHRSTLGLLVLWGSLIPFALIAAFQPKFTAVTDALQFETVTIFLLFTSFWIANYVAEAPQKRMRRGGGAGGRAAAGAAARGAAGGRG